jgi:hypothetical protein
MPDVGKMVVALLAFHQGRLWSWVPAFAGTMAVLVVTLLNSRSV